MGEISLQKLNDSINTPTDQEELRENKCIDDGRVGSLETFHNASGRDFVPYYQGEKKAEWSEIYSKTGHKDILAIVLTFAIIRLANEKERTSHLDEEWNHVTFYQ